MLAFLPAEAPPPPEEITREVRRSARLGRPTSDAAAAREAVEAGVTRDTPSAMSRRDGASMASSSSFGSKWTSARWSVAATRL
eukprot:scaffold60584_cov53-Phaeocystis_antarctica.AAC.7